MYKLLIAIALIVSSGFVSKSNLKMNNPTQVPNANKWYYIQYASNNLVIEVPDFKSLKGLSRRNESRIRLTLGRINGSQYQQWRFLESQNYKGYFRIINKGSNLVMDVPNSSTHIGTFIQQYKQLDQTTKNQFFKLVSSCNDEYFISPLNSGFALGAEVRREIGVQNPSGGAGIAAPIDLLSGWFVRQQSLGDTEQKWKLVEVK